MRASERRWGHRGWLDFDRWPYMAGPTVTDTKEKFVPTTKMQEKYTLDSLNELGGQVDERFQWNRPEDGREVWPSKLQYFLAITR